MSVVGSFLPVVSVVPDELTLVSAVMLVMSVAMMRGIHLMMTEALGVGGRRLGRPHLSLDPRVAASSAGDGRLLLRPPLVLGDPPAGVSLLTRVHWRRRVIGLEKFS